MRGVLAPCLLNRFPCQLFYSSAQSFERDHFNFEIRIHCATKRDRALFLLHPLQLGEDVE
jgi:hypothetical protein